MYTLTIHNLNTLDINLNLNYRGIRLLSVGYKTIGFNYCRLNRSQNRFFSIQTIGTRDYAFPNNDAKAIRVIIENPI